MTITDINIADIKPTVNLNGNSKESLVDEWLDFESALENTLEKFPYDSFHGRNLTTVKATAAKRQLLELLNDLKDLSHKVALEIHES